MATIENFLLRFKVDGQGAIDKASASIQNLSNEVAGLGANTGPLNSAIGGIVSRLGPLGAAAGAAAGAFAALGLQAINLAASISDIAGATGIAEGTLLNFRTSVIEAGGSAEDFGQIAAKLNQNVQEAAGGNEKLQESFRRLGVFVTDAEGRIRSTEDILRDITERFRDGSLNGERYSAAVDILGKNITKLDLQKLQAVADPVKDAEIKKLDAYSEAIDRVRDRLERKLVSFFGGLALDIEKAQNKLEEMEAAANKRGMTRGSTAERMATGPMGGINPFGIGGARPGERRMTEKERADYQRQQYEAEMARLMAPYRPRPNEREPQQGGYGAPDPERLKREAEARRKEAERLAEQQRRDAERYQEQLAKELQTIKDMGTGYTRAADNNIKRLKIQESLLNATEYERRLVEGRFEIETRYGDQIAALEAKKATAKQETLKYIQFEIEWLEILRDEELETFKITSQRTFEYEQQQAAVARITQEIELQIQRQQKLADIIRDINDKKIDLGFERSLRGLNPLQKQIARINEDARKGALEAGRQYSEAFDAEDGLTPERAEELAQGLDLIAKGYTTIAEEQIAQLEYSRTWAAGWEEAFEQYRDQAFNSANQAKSYFDTFTRGFENAIIRFVQTGKLSFKDLINSLLAEFARVQASKMLMNFLGASGAGGFFKNLFGGGFGTGGFFGNLDFGGFFANGGRINPNEYGIVGERGPEIVTGPANITPFDKMAQQPVQVTYNINAVDASSFRALVARDPQFIYNISEQGRRSQPARRLS